MSTQLDTANKLLAQNLTTLSFDELVNLCLVKKANPTALPSFGRSLQTEINRRYDETAITKNPAEFAVLQNFANVFADPVGEFEFVLRTMHGQINKDVWFTNNREYFIRIINDPVGVAFLLANQEVLAACLDNDMARAMVLASHPLIEAIVVDSTAFESLLGLPNIWDELADSDNTMTIFAKSSQIIDRIIAAKDALPAVLASQTAMTAVAASQTAMTAVAASQTAMTAVAASQTAMTAVAASQTAMTAVAASQTARDAFVANNTNFQNVRTILYDMVKTNWTKQAQTAQDGVANAKNPMAQKTGLVFACLGYYNTKVGATSSMLHKNSTLAATSGGHSSPQSMLSVDAVSFDGATFTEQGDGFVYCELWVPKENN